MNTLPLVYFDDPILEKKAVPIKEEEFGHELEKYLSLFVQTLYVNRGIGLAGPQVGDLRRFIVVEDSIFNDKKYGEGYYLMVNPEIISSSGEVTSEEEGCLSCPGFYQRVDRQNRILVRYFSPLGEKMEVFFTGWTARIIQHEIDHLEGKTLFNYSSGYKRDRYKKKIIKALKDKINESLRQM